MDTTTVAVGSTSCELLQVSPAEMICLLGKAVRLISKVLIGGSLFRTL